MLKLRRANSVWNWISVCSSALSSLLLLVLPLSQPCSAKTQKRKSIPYTSHYQGWQPIFFEEIRKRAKLAKLSDLRLVPSRKDDLELRVWIGFGPAALEGFVIRRRTMEWSAMHLRSVGPQLARSEYQKLLPPPKSGWEPVWQQLVDKGVLTLPDSGKILGTDFESFVVEIKTDSSYRTYMYDSQEDSREGRNMAEIVQTIREEFVVPR